MPIYEYHCKNCGHQFEIMQKITETPSINCVKCGKNTLEKIISSTQFQLKGTGWYATDFKDSGKPKESNTSSKEGSDVDKKPNNPPASDSK